MKSKLSYLFILILLFSMILTSCGKKSESEKSMTGTELMAIMENPSQVELWIDFNMENDPWKTNNVTIPFFYGSNLVDDEDQIEFTNWTFSDSTIAVILGYYDGYFGRIIVPDYVPGHEISFNISCIHHLSNGDDVERNYQGSIQLAYPVTWDYPEDVDIYSQACTVNWSMAHNNMIQFANAYSYDPDLVHYDHKNYNISASARSMTFPKNCVTDYGYDSYYQLSIDSFNYNLHNKLFVDQGFGGNLFVDYKGVDKQRRLKEFSRNRVMRFIDFLENSRD